MCEEEQRRRKTERGVGEKRLGHSGVEVARTLGGVEMETVTGKGPPHPVNSQLLGQSATGEVGKGM